MTISGKIKFFYENYGDINNDNGYAIASTGSNTRNNARSRKQYLRWESVGSDDVTTETYQLGFGANEDINRIVLNRHNFKAFTVQYWNGAAWTHFANVVTKEGTQTNITETTNDKTTNYYEFDYVNTSKILISVDTTIAVDAEKYIYEVIATEELGTFEGFPAYAGAFAKKRAIKQSFEGTQNQSILGENFTCSLSFQRYGVEADHTLIQDLWELDKPFLIYPCGANEDQYRFTNKVGNRLRDIFLVGFSSDFSPNYELNVFELGLNYSVSFKEAT